MDDLRNITPELSAIKTGTRGFKDEAGNYFLTALGGDFIPAGPLPPVFYKCASVTPASAGGVLVSGSDVSAVNGTYELEDSSATGSSRKWIKGDCYIEWCNGEFDLYSGSSMIAYSGSANPSDEPYDIATWYACSYAGSSVAPAVTLGQAAAASWTGYKAVLSNGVYSFASTATTGLTFTSVTPVVDGIYTADCLCTVQSLYTGN